MLTSTSAVRSAKHCIIMRWALPVRGMRAHAADPGTYPASRFLRVPMKPRIPASPAVQDSPGAIGVVTLTTAPSVQYMKMASSRRNHFTRCSFVITRLLCRNRQYTS